MLVNDLTSRLERQSLRDEESNQAVNNCPKADQPPARCENNVNAPANEPIMIAETSQSPLIRGISSRMSLPFSNELGHKSSGPLSGLGGRGQLLTGSVDADVEELPIKRRHCSWAAADFRLHTGAPLARRSDTNGSDVAYCEPAAFELVKPVPIRPVLAPGGSSNEFGDASFCKDDFGLRTNHPQFSPSVPRPSSASSGIFDLDSSSECSARRDGQDRFSNGWSSSADERRRSEEDSNRDFAGMTSSFKGRNLAKAGISCARHGRGAPSRLSASGGFLPLALRNDDHVHFEVSSNTPTPSTSQNALTVPSSSKSISSNWWRSAPDLIGGACNGTLCSQSSEDDSDWRRSQRKRNLSGRLQARPSIDLFKNVADDDSSCGGESLITDGTTSETNDNCSRYFQAGFNEDASYAGNEFELNGKCNKFSTGRASVENRGTENEDNETDSDSHSLSASVRSTAGTFGEGIELPTEQTPVTRSLSYPWLRSHINVEEHHGKNNYYDMLSVRRSVGITGRRTGRSANVVPALIDDGLRTIVGSPADTSVAVAATVASLPSKRDDNNVAVSPTINLLNYVTDAILDCSNSPESAIVGVDKTTSVISRSKEVPECNSIIGNHEVDMSNTRHVSSPPQLIDGPIMFLPRYTFQNELDIDLIEQN